ncbi:MAG: tyrosine-type recombinase/integrase [Terriglobales bacterium]
MAKRRHQSPALKPHGGWWTIRVRRDILVDGKLARTHLRVKIAPVSTPMRQTQKLRDQYLERVNFAPPTLGAAVTLQAFTDGIFRKIDLPTRSKSHRERYESVLKIHLLPALGKCTMFDLEQQSSTLVEEFFIGLAVKKLSLESYRKIRNCGSSLFAVAIKKGYANRNPFYKAALPDGRPTPKQKPTITVEQLYKLIELISEPYATMVFISAMTGLRVSEILALRWKDILEWTVAVEEKSDKLQFALTIDEKFCRGEWGSPKTEASHATIAVLHCVVQRIRRLMGVEVRIGGGRGGYQTFKLVKSDKPDDLIFRGVRCGKEMRDNNILTRHIKPAARQLGFPFVNWQLLRRTHATLLKRAGVPLKDASFQMRHSRTATTAEIYQMTPIEDQVLAMEKLEALTAASGRPN